MDSIKRVVLDGDALVFRVKEGDVFTDRVFIRDTTQPAANNCWVQAKDYRTYVETYEKPSYCAECSKAWLEHDLTAPNPCHP